MLPNLSTLDDAALPGELLRPISRREFLMLGLKSGGSERSQQWYFRPVVRPRWTVDDLLTRLEKEKLERLKLPPAVRS